MPEEKTHYVEDDDRWNQTDYAGAPIDWVLADLDSFYESGAEIWIVKDGKLLHRFVNIGDK
jgi:hypothetical protein